MSDFRSGDILIFDRGNGKFLKKFNKKGRSAQEYLFAGALSADSEKGEIYMCDGAQSRLLIYDFDGNYIRGFDLPAMSITSLFNNDKENLICYDEKRANSGQPIVMIDKVSGLLSSPFEMPIPNDSVDFTVVGSVNESGNRQKATAYMSQELVKTAEGYLVGRPSSNIIYEIDPIRKTINGSIVRTPDVLTDKPQSVLYPRGAGREFVLLTLQKIEWDFTSQRGFGQENLIYFKESGECFVEKIVNIDYDGWQTSLRGNGGDYASGANCFVLSAAQLVADRDAGKLHGKLKEAASSLTEDDNPILVIATFK